jgi:hypothetical protein
MRTCFRAAAGCSLLLSAGCVSSNLGNRVGDETLRQFEAGVTTEAWLVAILGEPSTAAPVIGVENTKVFRYSLTEQRGGLMAMIYGDDRRTVSVVYFIITDGVVTRFWADRETGYTALGIPVETTGGVKE